MESKELEKQEETRRLYLLIGLLCVSLVLFGASMFDSNMTSTAFMGVVVIIFSFAVIHAALKKRNSCNRR